MIEKCSQKEIKKRINIAISILFDRDYFLIKEKVHERSISHKLGEYLQILFPGWNVDCEYNKKGLDKKQLEGYSKFFDYKRTDDVMPDIIIHKRNTTKNLLVIELKNKGAINYDRKKLELFTSADNSYCYFLGLLINFSNNFKELQLIWYKNGQELND